MNDLAVTGEVIDLVQGQAMSNGGALQRVATAYTTAITVQKARNLRNVEMKALDEAKLLGADAYYGWGSGEDHIEGPSKGLAMSLVRCYGNCAVDMGEVQETADAWIFTARFVDIETGFTLTRQFRQSKKWKIHGKFDEARKEDIRFQIGQSKAVRNVVLNALPEWLTRRALDAAKGGVREKIEETIAKYGISVVSDKALKKLDQLGAPPARVLAAMGRTVAAALTVEDLVLLHGNIALLETRADTVDALFPDPSANGNGNGAKSGNTLVAEMGKKPAATNSNTPGRGAGEAGAAQTDPRGEAPQQQDTGEQPSAASQEPPFQHQQDGEGFLASLVDVPEPGARRNGRQRIAPAPQ